MKNLKMYNSLKIVFFTVFVVFYLSAQFDSFITDTFRVTEINKIYISLFRHNLRELNFSGVLKELFDIIIIIYNNNYRRSALVYSC